MSAPNHSPETPRPLSARSVFGRAALVASAAALATGLAFTYAPSIPNLSSPAIAQAPPPSRMSSSR
jgi:hypothetical protein